MLVVLGLGLAAACGDGEVLALGAREPLPFQFGAPRRVANLDVAPKLDNPTLTADLLEIFFTAGVAETDTDVWTARRASRDRLFERPERLAEINSPAFETSSAISGDGLSLWFGSTRARDPGDHDIWLATRSSRGAEWSPPREVPELRSNGMDIPRPPGQHGLAMPMASDRLTPGFYQTFLAMRSDPSAAFTAPALIDELSFAGSATTDAFLSDDGLTLFFSSNMPPQPQDLYVAWRRSTSEGFDSYAALADLNTVDADERDPWLSPDGRELYYASNVSGNHAIYVAQVTRAVER
jgi:hypothetical protein